MQFLRFKLKTLLAAITALAVAFGFAHHAHSRLRYDEAILRKLADDNQTWIYICDPTPPPHHSGGVAMPTGCGGVAYRGQATPRSLILLPEPLRRYLFTRITGVHLLPDAFDTNCLDALGSLPMIESVNLNGMSLAAGAEDRFKALHPDATLSNRSYGVWGPLGGSATYTEDYDGG
ncbi:hypothetical protein Poly51_36070 [Rubripirellula tenax]|uniref:Leucine Rich repeats (2 copies) n=1 Tax=Rubripirellula tenax TaxID=2528015 RepID=A0A5C6F1E5_9BACT|nr:hypothetical protein [Rubripirellula tenax]TWU54885.1 hypothetical protein Poly51_36070 [Rubripirellula tenax]